MGKRCAAHGYRPRHSHSTLEGSHKIGESSATLGWRDFKLAPARWERGALRPSDLDQGNRPAPAAGRSARRDNSILIHGLIAQPAVDRSTQRIVPIARRVLASARRSPPRGRKSDNARIKKMTVRTHLESRKCPRPQELRFPTPGDQSHLPPRYRARWAKSRSLAFDAPPCRTEQF